MSMRRDLSITNRLNHKSTIADMWRKDVSKTSLMTPDEEYLVAVKAKEGDEKAQEKLVNSNLRFVLSMAKNFSNDSYTLDDLISAGNLGLVEASRKFDPTKGFKFISYAVWYVRKEMLNHLYENSRTVKIPIAKSQLLNLSKKASSEFLGKEGREPTLEETVEWMNAQETGKKVDINYLQDILNADSSPLSLTSPIGDDGNMLCEIIGQEDEVFLEMFTQRKTAILDLLNTLGKEQKFIVEKRLGMDGSDPWDYRSIGMEFSRSGEWTRTQYNRALKKLQIRGKKLLKQGSI